jgi:hypothetical protein
MKASEYAKSMGVKSLKEVSGNIDITYETLINWYTSRPALFRLIIIGYINSESNEKLLQIREVLNG